MKYPLVASILFLFISSDVLSQPLTPWNEAVIIENGDTLKNPLAGGMNQPQFSTIDFNGDLLNDLFIFDRAGNTILPFVNQGEMGNPEYQFDPSYRDFFPDLKAWALLVDFNCDGKPDIFTSLPDSSTITVYENTSQGNQISFQLYQEKLSTSSGKIFVTATDIPAITDVDGDGDIDILTFDSQGSHVKFFENQGFCNTLDFIVNTDCWGQFEEAGLDNSIMLNIACKRNGAGNTRHSGSSLTAFDYDGDNDMELILGDLNHPNIVFLNNGGDNSSALMNQVNTAFPSGTTPVDIRQFPASYFLDIDIDGQKDLIVAPNAPNISLNNNQVWYYKNTGVGGSLNFNIQQKDFLVGGMIDVGTIANTTFFDYNGDGLLDMLIGNYLYRETANQESSGLSLYENTGTSSLPQFTLITTDYLNLSSLFNPHIFGLAPTTGDLDNDGDTDLIIGDENGNLHYFQNQANQAGFVADFLLLAPFYASIDVGSSATPQLIDLNNDGLLDLLIGEKSGNLNFYENLGSLTQPFFSTGDNKFGFIDVLQECCTGYSVPFAFENQSGGQDLIVASEKGELFYYQNIHLQANDTFQLTGTFPEIQEGTRLSIFGADLDQDKKIEFVFGNRRGGISFYRSDFAISIENSIKKNNSFTLFPNPTNSRNQSQLFLKGQFLHTPTIEIYSIDGKLIDISSSNESGQNHQFPISKIQEGIYLVKVKSEGKVVKVIKWAVNHGF